MDHLDLITLTDRHSKCKISIVANMIESITDLRTDPCCTEDFYYTIIRCVKREYHVKETIEEITRKL